MQHTFVCSGTTVPTLSSTYRSATYQWSCIILTGSFVYSDPVLINKIAYTSTIACISPKLCMFFTPFCYQFIVSTYMDSIQRILNYPAIFMSTMDNCSFIFYCLCAYWLANPSVFSSSHSGWFHDLVVPTASAQLQPFKHHRTKCQLYVK